MKFIQQQIVETVKKNKITKSKYTNKKQNETIFSNY